jgi:hypothetical protein
VAQAAGTHLAVAAVLVHWTVTVVRGGAKPPRGAMEMITPEGARVVAEPAPRSAAEPLRSSTVEDGGGKPVQTSAAKKPATTPVGQLTIEGKRQLSPSEREAAQYWLEQGRNVKVLEPAGDRGIQNLRTPDFEVAGIDSLVRSVLKKSRQASIIQIELSKDSAITQEGIYRLPKRIFGQTKAGSNIQRIIVRKNGEVLVDATRRP